MSTPHTAHSRVTRAGRPRLVATDLDGTLVPADTLGPPPYTASVLRRLDAAGVPVVFTTARPLRWMDGFWPHVGRHGLAVVSNGAITVDVHAGRITELTGIDAPAGLAICSAIEAELPGAQFAIECADGIRLDPGYLEPPASPGAPRGPLADIWTDPAVKLLVRHPEVPDDHLQARAEAIVGPRATVTWSVPGLVEISAAGVTKASALRRLCRRLGVDADGVVAFGDMPNDVPMLAWAGTAYAVANAHPMVLEVADHVAPACADEGVARVLDRIALSASAAAEHAEVPADAGRALVEHFAANARAGAFYAREGFAVDRVVPSASGDRALDVVWRSRTIAGPGGLRGSDRAERPGRTREPS